MKKRKECPCKYCLDSKALPKPVGIKWFFGRCVFGLVLCGFAWCFGKAVFLTFFNSDIIKMLTQWLVVSSYLLCVVFVLYVVGTIFFRNIWGKTVYRFLDKDGFLHTHRENPYDGCWNLIETSEFDMVLQSVFRVRVGGIFRSNKVLFWGENFWTLEGWDGEHLVMKDVKEHNRGYVNFPIHELLEISNKFVWVMDVFDKLEEANACCDHLGLGVVGLIEEIKASKDTMGKSKHGQRAREALENVLNSNDEIRVLRASRWYEKHEQEKKAREAVKPEDPAIGVAGQNKKKQQVSTGATPKAATGTNPPTG